ncbi:MAG: ABC transporter ATP-binding protein [Candidatus Heimdallarchaeota archaeon]|nr:ABC transporter ATP-binding protein [Candidatus Heimdallarchaeota archaeon]MCK4876021.1 ABC transporter ATP-binding protein [Candidatus Heimdallarchaeota archaeon]
MDPILDVRNIYTYFYTESGIVEALDGVSFDVMPREPVGIVGESGCGKTVTAKSVLRILDKNGRTISGEIMYKGADLLKLPDLQMRRIRGKEIAMIFQDPMTSLNPIFRIEDQMTEVISLHRKCGKKEAKEIAIEMLDQVGIPDAEKRIIDYPHQFSGGMRQRILIARALSLQPSLLIADEPTTALDVTIQAQVLEIIKEMQKKLGLAMMLITHNLGVVAEITKRVHIFYGGRVVESGPTEEIFLNPKHPYTFALFESIPSLEVDKTKLETIPGMVPRLINPPKGCRFHPRCKYATEVCSRVRPPEIEFGKGRRVACHHFDELDLHIGKDALSEKTAQKNQVKEEV